MPSKSCHPRAGEAGGGDPVANREICPLPFAAILSNHTIIKSRTVPLPCSPKGEARVAVEITIALPSTDTIAFGATHLEAAKDETDRVNQAKKINEEFSANKYPTILAGDLNATPESLPISLLKNSWTDAHDQNNAEPT